MGKKGSWFVSVKKAFSPESKKSSKSKKKWGFGSQKHGEDPSFTSIETAPAAPAATAPSPPPPPPPPPQPEEVKVMEAQNEQSKQAYTVAVATAAAAEAAVAAAQATVQVVRLTNFNNCPGKSKEEVAAIKIQTAFRGYLARRALRALRGLVRLKTLIEGQSVKRQATTTLKCMQTLARLQSQIRARRIRMSEENLALQRQLQQNREKDLENLRASMGDDWDDSIQSKEQIEASLLSKHEATIRRERAMAYAYSHQSWKNSHPGNALFMDPQNPHWGWSWLERWMAARPWESRSTTEKEMNDHSSVKSASRSTVVGEITKSYAASRELKVEKPSPTVKKPLWQSPSTPSSKVLPPSSLPAGKLKSASPKAMYVADDDSRSIMSMQSERPRRHSIAGSSVRDDESLASSPAVPSYMAPTESARAKARLQSPLGVEKLETPDKGSSGSVKKRLSFSASPAGMRRHSGPPKIESQLIKDIGVNNTEQSVSNGSGGGSR